MSTKVKLDLIKLVSWDLDGTLYSIGRMKWHLLGLLMREIAAGRGPRAYRELAALRRRRARIDATRLAGGALDGALGEDANRELLIDAEKRWYGQAIRRTGPRAGVSEVISFLGARDVPQVLFSDYRADYKLDSLGLESRFANVYVGEHLGFVKPHPHVLERMAADFAVPIATLLHIGDRIDRDDRAARAAGCQCLILGRDFRSFQSLLDQLKIHFPSVI